MPLWLKQFICFHDWEYISGGAYYDDNYNKCKKCGKESKVIRD